MSDQSHGALKRAALIAGVRREHIRLVPSDDDFRMDLGELRRLVAEDRGNGLVPLAVCANAGTSSTGAVDSLPDMADWCAREGIWLHVDAAYGGFSLVTEEGRERLAGIDRADSVGLKGAFAIGNDVLQDTVWGANHPNFADRGLQLSRAARALKIWMSVQTTFGMAAFRVQSEVQWAIRAPLATAAAVMDDGTRIVVRRHGNPAGTRIVLSHANGFAADAYYPFWSLLTDRFDVVVYDFRNHGWNAVGELEAHAIPTFVRDMTVVAQTIERAFGEKPAVGVFHSLSGQTAAIEACSGAGSFAALVLFDPFICPQGCHPATRSACGRPWRGWLKERCVAAVPSTARRSLPSGCAGRRRSSACGRALRSCWRRRHCVPRTREPGLS